MKNVIRIILRVGICILFFISFLFGLNVTVTVLGYQPILWINSLLRLPMHDLGIVLLISCFLLFLVVWALQSWLNKK